MLEYICKKLLFTVGGDIVDSKSIGKTIANLRKRCGMTHSELADKLNVSNKAVSKWESGQGYPDISLFPLLSALFGVSIDYLMLQRKGIAVAGNILADVVKTINAYPAEGQLTTVSGISLAVGGCAPNVAIDLAKIDPQLSVSVHGRVGTDEYGSSCFRDFRNAESMLTVFLFRPKCPRALPML